MGYFFFAKITSFFMEVLIRPLRKNEFGAERWDQNQRVRVPSDG